MGRSQINRLVGLAKDLEEGWHGQDCVWKILPGLRRENTSSTQVILAFVRLSVGRYEDLFSGKASPT